MLLTNRLNTLTVVLCWCEVEVVNCYPLIYSNILADISWLLHTWTIFLSRSGRAVRPIFEVKVQSGKWKKSSHVGIHTPVKCTQGCRQVLRILLNPGLQTPGARIKTLARWSVSGLLLQILLLCSLQLPKNPQPYSTRVWNCKKYSTVKTADFS